MNPIEVNLLCSLIPSIVSGVGLYAISSSMNNHQEKLKKQEADHIKSEDHILNTLIATAEGTEAIARAIQRIPDAHCNDETFLYDTGLIQFSKDGNYCGELSAFGSQGAPRLVLLVDQGDALEIGHVTKKNA